MLSLRRSLGVALLLAGIACFSTPVQAIEIKLLPNNTEIVVTVNIKQILSSDIVKGQKELINQLKAALETRIPDDRAIKYLEKLGFDPFKDLHSVTVAHNGSKDPEDLFLLVEGNFNPEKLLAVAKEAAEGNGDNLKITKIGSTNVYEVSPGGDKTFYVAHISKSLVVTANKDAMKGAITRSTSVGPFAPKVRELLKTTNDTQSLSFVITGDALGKLAEQAQQAKGLPNNALAGLGGIDGVSGAVTIAKNIDFLLGVGAKDNGTAKQFAEMGNALLPLGKTILAQKAKENQDLAPLMEVMKTLDLSTAGNNVVLRGQVTYANLDKLLKSLGSLKGGF